MTCIPGTASLSSAALMATPSTLERRLGPRCSHPKPFLGSTGPLGSATFFASPRARGLGGRCRRLPLPSSPSSNERDDVVRGDSAAVRGGEPAAPPPALSARLDERPCGWAAAVVGATVRGGLPMLTCVFGPTMALLTLLEVDSCADNQVQ